VTFVTFGCDGTHAVVLGKTRWLKRFSEVGKNVILAAQDLALKKKYRNEPE
jgi:hypothetical protein